MAGWPCRNRRRGLLAEWLCCRHSGLFAGRLCHRRRRSLSAERLRQGRQGLIAGRIHRSLRRLPRRGSDVVSWLLFRVPYPQSARPVRQ
jgi:hypothetical protein